MSALVNRAGKLEALLRQALASSDDWTDIPAASEDGDVFSCFACGEESMISADEIVHDCECWAERARGMLGLVP